MMIYAPSANEVDQRCELIRRNWQSAEQARRRSLAQEKQRRLIAILLRHTASSDAKLIATNAA